MKIEATEGPLTNFEVLQLLQQEKTSDTNVKEMDQNEIRVALSTAALRDTLTSQFDDVSENAVSEFIERAADFDLTEAEFVQIINCRPNGLPVLYAIIEECDQRYSDVQVEQLLSIIKETIGATA
eukprot:GDKJ01036533.1.p1 GENE.GDKJ01036533.1~~GDKJ01036533.1.p1  ORF type:complete len:125 (+),score=26.03 GDKJ01036533.1:21-395(+)